MDSTKIRNLIIIVLVLVNVFLLAMVLADRSEAKTAENSIRENVTKILSDNGIALADGIKVSGTVSGSFNIQRDLDKEKKMASSVLGKVYVADLGGNIYYYNGPNGQASFRSTGEFEMLLGSGAVSVGGDPVQTAQKILRKMGMDSDKNSAEIEQIDNDTLTVTLNVVWQGNTVYNCRVSFVFTSGRLNLIMGKRPFDRVEPDTDEELISMSTIIMRFLDIMNSGGYVCSEIQEIENGYIMDMSSPGVNTLKPVWKVITDTGEYFINGYTGEEVILKN